MLARIRTKSVLMLASSIGSVQLPKLSKSRYKRASAMSAALREGDDAVLLRLKASSGPLV